MRVSTMTVYRLIKAGELPAIRVGKHLRIRERDVAKYLDERVVGTVHRRRHRRGDRPGPPSDRSRHRHQRGARRRARAQRSARLTQLRPGRAAARRDARRRGRRPGRGHRGDPAALEGAEPQEGAGARRRRQPAWCSCAPSTCRRCRRTTSPAPCGSRPRSSSRSRSTTRSSTSRCSSRCRRPSAVGDASAGPADVAGAARGGAQGPDPQPRRRGPGRRASRSPRSTSCRSRWCARSAAGSPTTAAASRPSSASAAASPSSSCTRPACRASCASSDRAAARSPTRSRATSSSPPTRPRRSSARWTPRRPELASGRRAAMARPISGPRRADPRLARLLPHAARSIRLLRGHAHRRRRAHARVSSSSSSTPSACPVEPATPREHIEIGDIGFPDGPSSPLLDPFLPVPIGLALGGLLTGKRIDLLGVARPRADRPLAADQVRRASSAAALLVVLGGLYFLKKRQVDDERDELATAEAEEPRRCRARSTRSPTSRSARRRSRRSRSRRRPCSPTDVAWSTVLQGLSRTIPSDVWLTSFQGTVSAGHDRRHRHADHRHDREHDRHRHLRRGRHQLRRRGRVDPPHRHRTSPTSRTSGCRARPRAGRARPAAPRTDENVTFSSTANLTDKAKSDRAEAFKVTP